MTYEDTYSAAAIDYHVRNFYPSVACSAVSASFCIFIILRYSSQSMGSSYRFHLLNITVWTLFCDLNITVLTQFYSLQPVNGGCYPGVLPKMLMKWFQVSTTVQITICIYGFIFMANIATMANATIHRYLLVANMAGKEVHTGFSKVRVTIFMVFLQVIWPLVAGIIGSSATSQSKKAIEEARAAYPEMYPNIVNQPCIFVPNDVDETVKVYLFLSPVIFHILFCNVLNFTLLILSWRKIFDAQRGAFVSRRTLQMERRLLITLTIQSLFPCFVFVSCILSFVVKYCFSFYNNFGSWTDFLFPMHSVFNVLIILCTIPIYYRGLAKDLLYLFTCGGRFWRWEGSQISSVSSGL